MTTLSGDRIQELLWIEGMDFQYVTTDDDYNAIHITCGDRWLRLERLWGEEASEGWVLDIGDIIISLVDEGEVTMLTDSSADTEDDLVLELRGYFDQYS